MPDQRETDTPLIGVAMPKGEQEIRDEIIKRTQGGKTPCFWAPDEEHWYSFEGRPDGTRPSPEHVAMLIYNEELNGKGQVELRYHDGYKTRLLVTELAKGRIYLAGEVAQRWAVCEIGEIDLKGHQHTS